MPELVVTIDAKGAVLGAKRVKNSLEGIDRKAKSTTNIINPMNAAIGAIGSAAALVGISRITDSYQVLALQLEYATGSTEGAASAQKKLYDISKQTGTSIDENANAFVKLQQAQKLTKLSSDDNFKVIKALNTLMIQTGTSGQQASAAMLQLSQALTSGQLSGDEFKSMAENAPGVLNMMAEAMKIPREELKAMAADGELTSQRLGKALLDIANNAETGLKPLPNTVGKAWNQVVLAFENAWDRINDDTGIMGMVADGIAWLADWIEAKTPALVEWVSKLVQSLQENWPEIQTYLAGVAENFARIWNVIINNVSVIGLMENMGDIFTAAARGVEFLAAGLEKIEPYMNTLRTIARISQLGSNIALGTGGGIIGAIETAQNTDLSDFFQFGSNENTETRSSGIGSTTNINITTPVSPSSVRTITSQQQRDNSRG